MSFSTIRGDFEHDLKRDQYGDEGSLQELQSSRYLVRRARRSP